MSKYEHIPTDGHAVSPGATQGRSIDAYPFEYDVSVGPFVGFFRSRSTETKVLLTVGAPMAIVLITAGLAFYALGSISEALADGSEAALVEASAVATDLRYVLFGAVGFSVLLTLILFSIIRVDIIRTVRQITDCMRRIATGQHNLVVPHRNRVDEYGALCNEIEQLRIAAIELEKLGDESATRASMELEEQTRQQLQRDEALNQRTAMLSELANQFEHTVGDVASNVVSAANELQTTSSMMAKTADEASRRTEHVAEAMTDAHTGATAAAAASDEFAMSIGEISRQAASSAELARKATQSATRADKTISELSESALQVGQIVELIQTIAQRTNLLALNASIEAARGGEAGRGFAVVASEVKELAMQTSRATQQVAEQINAMQETTGASVSALRSIAGEVQQLEVTAVSIASAVDQQSVAGQDLARSIDLAARGTESVSSHIQEVSDLSLSTGSAASQVLASSTALEQQAATLRGQVDAFLSKVRAG